MFEYLFNIACWSFVYHLLYMSIHDCFAHFLIRLFYFIFVEFIAMSQHLDTWEQLVTSTLNHMCKSAASHTNSACPAGPHSHIAKNLVLSGN